jgi:hypothetical protein
MGWAGVALSVLGQAQQAQAQKQYFDYMSRLADISGEQLSKTTELENQDIYNNMVFDLKQLDSDGKKIIGAQRAAAGASGIGTDSVTFENILTDTLTSIAKDEAQVRNNAEIAAFRNRQQAALEKINLKNQSAMYGMSGQNAQTSGYLGAASSILGGASQYTANKHQRQSLTTGSGISANSRYKLINGRIAYT